jgi:hypothetical protein
MGTLRSARDSDPCPVLSPLPRTVFVPRPPPRGKDGDGSIATLGEQVCARSSDVAGCRRRSNPCALPGSAATCVRAVIGRLFAPRKSFGVEREPRHRKTCGPIPELSLLHCSHLGMPQSVRACARFPRVRRDLGRSSFLTVVGLGGLGSRGKEGRSMGEEQEFAGSSVMHAARNGVMATMRLRTRATAVCDRWPWV